MKTIKCKLSLYLLKMYSEYNVLLHKMGLPRLFITTRDEIKGNCGDYFCAPSIIKDEYFKLINVFTVEQKTLNELGLGYNVFQYVAKYWWKQEGFSSPDEMEETLRKIYPNATALYVHVMKEVLLEDEK